MPAKGLAEQKRSLSTRQAVICASRLTAKLSHCVQSLEPAPISLLLQPPPPVSVVNILSFFAAGRGGLRLDIVDEKENEN